MPSQIIIRPVTRQDRPEWETLWAGYNAFYGRHGETALPDSIIRSSWDRLLKETEPVHGLVAEADATLVGLAHFIFHRNMIQIEDTCYLQDLFTSPECRGLGVARQLAEAVYAVCKTRGVSSIYWHTHASNTAARALYDKLATNTGFLVYRAKA